MSEQMINIDNHSFKIVLTSETEGYSFTHCTYDLFFKQKRIAKDISSITSCYNVAWEYIKNNLEKTA